MSLQDRIELENRVFNVFSQTSENLSSIYSVLYIEESDKCRVLKFYSKPLNVKGEEDMKLSSLHNSVLSKLFKALRQHPVEPEKAFEEESDSGSENSKLQTPHDVTAMAGNERSIEKNKTEALSTPSGEIDLRWEEFCRAHLPGFVTISLLADQNRIIGIYPKNSLNSETENEIHAIQEIFEKNREKLKHIIGKPQTVIHTLSDGYFFFFFLPDQKQLVLRSKKGTLGLYLKELETFKKALTGFLNE